MRVSGDIKMLLHCLGGMKLYGKLYSLALLILFLATCFLGKESKNSEGGVGVGNKPIGVRICNRVRKWEKMFEI